MSGPRALVVDDEPHIRELLQITLARMEVSAVCAENLERAYLALQHEVPDLCLTDMRLPDGSGLELVRHLSQQHPDLPVAVITAHGDVKSAVESLKAGAFDFVTKPVDLPVLRNLVNTALRLGQARRTATRTLIGESAAMREVRATIAKLARSQAPVFIRGESGTGKELAARMVHDLGPRSGGPFMPVNCGAIPADLMESELFGHRRGAFTGAVADKPGLFQAADGGTLFLDEVAELPPATQVKLLRAIQEKRVRPVGEENEVAVDVRILSASHRDLGRLVHEGTFREDLYYRLDVITLTIPPLRDRLEDIPALAGHILARLCGGTPGGVPELDPDALSVLATHEFPGNVRELENLLERAVAMCESGRIETDDLGLGPARRADVPRASSAPADSVAQAPEHAPAPPVVPGLSLDGTLDQVLEAVERQTILNALEQERWNKTRAAKRLGISFGALRYRMQKLGLD